MLKEPQVMSVLTCHADMGRRVPFFTPLTAWIACGSEQEPFSYLSNLLIYLFLAKRKQHSTQRNKGGVHLHQMLFFPQYSWGISERRAIFFNLPSFTPPVRATVGEVRYSIEIDVGGE